MSPERNIIAKAFIQESFPCTFGIYDLPEFLAVMSMFDKPELQFDSSEKFMVIEEGANSVQYFSAAPGIIHKVMTIKDIEESDPIQFKLSNALLTHMKKSSAILKVEDLFIEGDKKELKLVMKDKSNPTGNSFMSILGSTNKTFSACMQTNNLKLMNADYDVTLSPRGLARFNSADDKLEYYIALENNSKF